MKAAAAIVLLIGLVVASNAQVYRRLREAETCPESGFYQNADDCQSFYRCAEHIDSDGGIVVNKFEFKCPPGTIFDESIATCNHIYAVEKTSPECIAAAEATLEEIRQRVDTTTPAAGGMQQGGQYQYNLRPSNIGVPNRGQSQRLVYQPQQQFVYQQPAYQLHVMG